VFRSPASRQALLASLCLTIFTQQPLLAAESLKIVSSILGTPPLVARAGLSQLPDVGTISETSTVFDAEEKIWKRWFVETSRVNGSVKEVLHLATSADGNAWQSQDAVCFEPALDSNKWDATTMGAPVIVANPAGAKERKFLLWYAGSNQTTVRPNGMAATSIGLAYSADGRKFQRISAAESPCSVEGMVLTATQTFPDSADVTEGCLGQPSIVYREGVFSMSFYKVGADASGKILGAGIARAVSSDGIKWNLSVSAPVTVQLVGKSAATSTLVERLKQLANAYSEASM